MEASADQERGTKIKVRKITRSAIRASLGDIVNLCCRRQQFYFQYKLLPAAITAVNNEVINLGKIDLTISRTTHHQIK